MKSMDVNVREAARALVEKPLFATSVERVLILNEIKSDNKELPHPLRFAKSLSILLSRVSTPLEPYDLIAGRCVDRELTEEEEQIFQEFIHHPDYPGRRMFLNSGHCTYSWESTAELGLVGLRERAERKLATVTDEDEKHFLSGMIGVYDALIAYALRYADEARRQGLREMEENLREVATDRPRHFASALQLLWIVALVNCAYLSENPTLTVGRLDQILYPFYCRDVEDGILTKERAAEYITDYYCKHNLIMGRGEHQVGDATNSTTFKRICNFDAPQYLLLAGTDMEGKPAVNELTELFAECIVPSFKNPVVVVRYFKDLDQLYPKLWKTLTEKAIQSASMMFYNDDNVLATYRRLGLPMEDCRRYAHFGCNWPSPGDNSAWMNSGPRADAFGGYASEEEAKELRNPYLRVNADHGWAEDLMIVLRELALRDPETVTIEDVYEGFFARMAEFIDRKLDRASRELAARRRRPSAALSYTDCFRDSAAETAQSFSVSSKYHFQFQSFYMFGTVADSFIAVDQLVMREKKLTLARLLRAVDADFVGYEDVLALCRNAEKYGMDTPLSNFHAKRLAETASNLTIEKSKPYLEKEGLFLEPCMQSDTWHLKYGEQYGATPDGRRAYTPFSQNSRPSNGACVNGVTGMLNSMLCIPSDGVLSGALNLDVDPKQFAGESGRALFASLLGVYLNRGGLHAQVTSVDPRELIDAKAHPEQHRDLRVRVTGYSGIFVDMPERLQNDMIERMK